MAVPKIGPLIGSQQFEGVCCIGGRLSLVLLSADIPQEQAMGVGLGMEKGSGISGTCMYLHVHRGKYATDASLCHDRETQYMYHLVGRVTLNPAMSE
jgi:hypothetical protein